MGRNRGNGVQLEKDRCAILCDIPHQVMPFYAGCCWSARHRSKLARLSATRFLDHCRCFARDPMIGAFVQAQPPPWLYSLVGQGSRSSRYHLLDTPCFSGFTKKTASRRIPGLQEMVRSCMYLFRVLNNYLLRKPRQLARSLLRALQESRVRAAGKAIQDHSRLLRK